MLVRSFLERYRAKPQRPVEGIEPEAYRRMMAYAWPGNVRELQNVVERACALTESDVVKRRDLPEYLLAGEGLRAAAAALGPDVDPRGAAMHGVPLVEARERWMAVLEGTYLRDLLDRHDGNISAAAKTAGIDRKTFHRLVSKHQIR